MKSEYEKFLQSKVIISEDFGFDIIERLINRYSMKGDTVYDPFGGLFSTAYKAIEMGRKAISVELNTEYFQDGCFYVNAKNYSLNVPTLFDIVN